MAKVGPHKPEAAAKKPGTGIQCSIHEQLPEWMRSEAHAGIEELSEFVVPPRMKVVQKQSGPPFDDLFSAGEVCIVPQMVKLAGVIPDTKDVEPFFFVPLFFFPEWCVWNPLELKGTHPSVRERTTDPSSPIVAKCRDSRLWSEPCPELPGKFVRYVEHLNFIITLISGELAGMPIVMSFARAEHRSGSNFAAMIKMRRAPIFGCQFMARTAYRTNTKGQWYGIDVTNPTPESGVFPFVTDQEVFVRFKAVHEELKAAHQSSKIRVDYDDVQDEPAVDPNATEY